jgi:hypothetical protein
MTDLDGVVAARALPHRDGLTAAADTPVFTAADTHSARYVITGNTDASSSGVSVKALSRSASGIQAAKLSPFATLYMQSPRGQKVLESHRSLSRHDVWLKVHKLKATAGRTSTADIDTLDRLLMTVEPRTMRGRQARETTP